VVGGEKTLEVEKPGGQRPGEHSSPCAVRCRILAESKALKAALAFEWVSRKLGNHWIASERHEGHHIREGVKAP
jgi:hypothetical protein